MIFYLVLFLGYDGHNSCGFSPVLCIYFAFFGGSTFGVLDVFDKPHRTRGAWCDPRRADPEGFR